MFSPSNVHTYYKVLSENLQGVADIYNSVAEQVHYVHTSKYDCSNDGDDYDEQDDFLRNISPSA